ncbi:hypothetical protein AeRB84_011096 [Aphanomyces euteiches]|nr:hypothetical protein AeRB84_011096 [Aphanomyces euteiches]
MGDEASIMALKLGLRAAVTTDGKVTHYHDNATDIFNTHTSVPAVVRRKLTVKPDKVQPPGTKETRDEQSCANAINQVDDERSTDGRHAAPSRRKASSVLLPVIQPPQQLETKGNGINTIQVTQSSTHVQNPASNSNTCITPELSEIHGPGSFNASLKAMHELRQKYISCTDVRIQRKDGEELRQQEALELQASPQRPQSPNTLFLANCERAKILPEPIIQKARASSDGSLNLSSYSIGDTLVEAMAESLSRLEELKAISFKDNRLTDDGIKYIVDGLLKSRVQVLDVSRNAFTMRGIVHITPLVMSSTSPLMDLNLENNNLGDNAVGALCLALEESRHLTRLNLSRCNIGHRGATALGKALKYTLSLIELFLSWNKIRGHGAFKLAEGLRQCGTLKTLDLSWNSFGSVTTSNSLRALCQALQENQVLTHLDLSHNRLREKDCHVLSNALKHNTSIRGIHVGGNDLGVDAYGFLFPDATQNDPANAHIFSRIGNNKMDKLNQWEKRSNCWICERWVEVRFMWNRGIVAPREVLLRAEFDYWRPHNAVPCREDATIWEIHRMVPPGMSQFFFVVDGIPVLSESHIQQPFEARIWGGINNHFNGLELPNPVNFVCNPRTPTPVPNRVDDWFSRSVFSNFQQDTSMHLLDAFESDWNVSRLPRITKDENERDKIKQILSSNFSLLKSVFKHYASSGGTDPFTMGSNAFFDFINECDIADQDTCTRAEIEMCFIASSSSGPKTKWNTRRNLFRFQFIETIAYLALSKFLKSKRVATASEAICTMLNDHIATNGAWHDSQAYRTGLHHSNTQRVCLYSIRVDAIFKEHLFLLKDVFSKFAGSLESVPTQLAKAKRMSFSEFMLLCDQVHMVDESLPAREVKIALVRAKETELFDPERDMEELKKINFGEFIETCARIADAKDLTSFYDKILMDSLKVHSSSRDDWSSFTGCLPLKLLVILKQLCIPAVRERKISIPPLMVKQISYIASAFVVSGL